MSGTVLVTSSSDKRADLSGGKIIQKTPGKQLKTGWEGPVQSLILPIHPAAFISPKPFESGSFKVLGGFSLLLLFHSLLQVCFCHEFILGGLGGRIFLSQASSSITRGRGPAQLWGEIPRAEGIPVGPEDLPASNPSLEDGEGKFPGFLHTLAGCSHAWKCLFYPGESLSADTALDSGAEGEIAMAREGKTLPHPQNAGGHNSG